MKRYLNCPQLVLPLPCNMSASMTYRCRQYDSIVYLVPKYSSHKKIKFCICRSMRKTDTILAKCLQ